MIVSTLLFWTFGQVLNRTANVAADAVTVALRCQSAFVLQRLVLGNRKSASTPGW
jgi:hypothetical protein